MIQTVGGIKMQSLLAFQIFPQFTFNHNLVSCTGKLPLVSKISAQKSSVNCMNYGSYSGENVKNKEI